MEPRSDRFAHVSVTVTDLPKAKHFYGEILGFREADRPDFGDIRGAWYQLDGSIQLHLIVNDELRRSEAERRGFTLCYAHFALWSDRLAEIEDRLRRSDQQVFPNETPGTGLRQIFIKDPDGNMIEFQGRSG